MLLAEGGRRGLPSPAELMRERGRFQVPPRIRVAAELRLESGKDLDVLLWGHSVSSLGPFAETSMLKPSKAKFNPQSTPKAGGSPRSRFLVAVRLGMPVMLLSAGGKGNWERAEGGKAFFWKTGRQYLGASVFPATRSSLPASARVAR
jgi:hypothetical protein